MSEYSVKVPDVGEGVAEVELVSWSVERGQRVTRHQTVAEVMTDKATVEVPSPVDGVINALTGEPGDVLLVGDVLFTLDLEGADAPAGVEAEPRPVTPSPGGDTAPPTSGPAAPSRDHRPTADAAAATGTGPAPASGPAITAADAERTAAAQGHPSAGGPTTTSRRPATAGRQGPEATGAATPAAATSGPPSRAATEARATPTGPARPTIGPPRPEGQRPTASPAVRRRAREAGIDLRTVTGSGPAGRITHEDLDAVFTGTAAGVATNGHRPRPPDTAVTDQPIIGVRRKIADRMLTSTSTIPHITYVDEVDVTHLEDLRQALNARPAGGEGGQARTAPRLTLLPFLIRALVDVLPEFPVMNAHVLDGAASGDQAQPSVLRTFGGVHVGIATQTDAGLVVPVVRHAEAETLWSTAARIAELADAARTGSIAPADLSGSTITITSLGPLGGLVTTPVVNKPEAAIIGVNKIVTRPVWDGRDFVPRKVMNLSSSFDHRVIDGWDAARFIQAIRQRLEQPALLFVDHE